MRGSRRKHAALLLGAGVLLLQLSAVLNPDIVEVDPEEMYNASHAFELTQGHLREALLLQYRSFCGGCTLNALLGAGLFSLLPPLWPVWKLVPIGFTVLLVVLGVEAMGRRQGLAAGVMLGGLLLLPPMSYAALSLIGWGNHYECGVIVALSVLLVTGRLTPGRLLLLGVLLSGGVWVGFSALFALPAAAIWLLHRLMRQQVSLRRLLWLLPGMLLGAVPFVLMWLSTGTGPLGEIYGGGEASPRLSHIPTQLATLLHPRQLAGFLGAPQLPMTAVLFGGSVAAAVGLTLRSGPPLARAALVFIASWAAIYLLSGFHIPIPPAPELPRPAALRYFAPLPPLLMLMLASVAGQQWRQGRRSWAWGVLAGPLLVGLLSRAAIFSAPFPVWNAATLSALDHDIFRRQASYLLSVRSHRQCTAQAPQSRALHAFALGLQPGESAVEPAAAFAVGMGQATIDRLDPHHSGELHLLAAVGEGAMLRAALLERRYSPAPWLQTMEGHDEASIARAAAALSSTPIRAEAWWLIGTRWGEDTARFLVPTDLALPVIDTAAVPPTFAVGLGEALGERWGPLAAVPCPDNLPADWTPIFLDGYATGVARRWPMESQAAVDRAECIPPTSARH